MKCPFCAHQESKVTESRISSAGDVIRRRRECEKCARRFTSYERAEEPLPVVVKKDGRRETFDRQKLLRGVRSACSKRPVSLETIEGILDVVERELIATEAKEVMSQKIGERVMTHLQQIDDVAYVRFASVYRSFRDIGEFRDELEKIARTKDSSPPSQDDE